MFGSNYSPSLTDIAAVTGNGSNGALGNNGWWILIILFALFGGWGNYGNRGGVGSNGGVTDGYVLASDFANIERKIDGVNNGLCDGFYAQNTSMLNGFSNIGSKIDQTGYQAAQLANGIQMQAMQNANTAQAQLADCCCKNEAAIAQLKFDMASGLCEVKTLANTLANQIMQNDNANYRSLHDENVAAMMEAKNNRIAELEAQLNRADRESSNARQTEVILETLLKKCGCCNNNSCC